VFRPLTRLVAALAVVAALAACHPDDGRARVGFGGPPPPPPAPPGPLESIKEQTSAPQPAFVRGPLGRGGVATASVILPMRPPGPANGAGN